MKLLRVCLATVLIACMIFGITLTPGGRAPAYAAQLTYSRHWASDIVEKWVSDGFLTG